VAGTTARPSVLVRDVREVIDVGAGAEHERLAGDDECRPVQCLELVECTRERFQG
jgi:hypothetical protein